MNIRELINYYDDTKKIKCIVYMKENVIHREYDLIKEKDQPALIEFYNTENKYALRGNIKSKKYFINGISYRSNDKPCEVQYFDVKGKNKIKSKIYRNIDGEIHRDSINGNGGIKDQPAIIEYYPGGQLKFKAYYINGKLQRASGVDEPTHMQYYLTEENLENALSELTLSPTDNVEKPLVLEYEVYSKNGLPHRDPYDETDIYRPAYLKYDKNGKITYEGFYKDGTLLKSIEHS